jgi:hypothetical protein
MTKRSPSGKGFKDPTDLVGRRFGKLTVVSYIRKEAGRASNGETRNNYFYLCRCACGSELQIRRWNLITGHTKSCGCFKNAPGKRNPNWRGYEGISGKFWSDIRARARKSRRKFRLTIRQAWGLFQSQESRCALSGLPLVMESEQRLGETEKRTASLDRIDSTKGYEPRNVQWVHKEINRMKTDLPEQDFVRFCCAVAATRGGTP